VPVVDVGLEEDGELVSCEVGTGDAEAPEEHPQFDPGFSPQLQQQWSPDDRMQLGIIGCCGYGEVFAQFQAPVPQTVKTDGVTGAVVAMVATGNGVDPVTTGATEFADTDGLLDWTRGLEDGRVVME